MVASFRLVLKEGDMTYYGPKRNFRFVNPKGHVDRFSWYNLDNGSVVPISIQGKLTGLLQSEGGEVEHVAADPQVKKKVNLSHKKIPIKQKNKKKK